MTSDLSEETLETKHVFHGRLLNLVVDTVRLPNGTITNREIVQHPGASAIVPILADGQVVLIRQFRKPTNEHLLEIPAGTLEHGEEPEHCAYRELTEETGFNAGKLRKLPPFYLAPGYSSEIIHIFIATDLTLKKNNLEDDEMLEVITLPFSEAIGLIDSGQIIDSKTIAGLLMAHRLHNQNKQED